MKLFKTLFLLWKNPKKILEKNLLNEFPWYKIFILFTCDGIVFFFYVMKSKGLFKVEDLPRTFAVIFTLLFLGSIYGLVSNIILGFNIKLTGKLFNGTNNLKKIYTALAWSFYPLTISVIIIIINFILARILIINSEQTGVWVLSFIILFLAIINSILYIWHLILLFIGLKMSQELNKIKTLLNYLFSIILYGLFYYFFIYPYF